MNSPNHPLAVNSRDNSIESDQHYCKYCGVKFRTNKPHQVFCKPEHKKAFEKVMSELISEIRHPLYIAAEKLAAARLNHGR